MNLSLQEKCHKIKFQYNLSFMMFLNLAPSALISWPGRGILGNPFPSLTTSISVGSLTPRQILCSMQQAIIVEDTFSTDSSSLFSRHLHLPFNSPNACSTTTLALLNDLLKSRWLSAGLWSEEMVSCTRS